MRRLWGVHYLPVRCAQPGRDSEGERAALRGLRVCVPVCPQGALGLVRRPEAEVLAPPATEADWPVHGAAAARGVDLERVQ